MYHYTATNVWRVKGLSHHTATTSCYIKRLPLYTATTLWSIKGLSHHTVKKIAVPKCRRTQAESLLNFLGHTHTHTHTQSHSHTYTHSHTVTLTNTYTHSHAHTHTLTVTHTFTLTHTVTLILTHSHTHTFTQSQSRTQSHTLTQLHSNTHTYSHSHNHTHTHSQAHTVTLTVTITNTHSHSHIQSHSHTYTHSHTQSHSHSHSHTHPVGLLRTIDAVGHTGRYLHNKHRRRKFMPSAVFEPATPTPKHLRLSPQGHADRPIILVLPHKAIKEGKCDTWHTRMRVERTQKWPLPINSHHSAFCQQYTVTIMTTLRASWAT